MTPYATMDGVWAKYRRAVEHADEFDGLLSRYAEDDSYRVTFEFDPETGWHHFKWDIRAEPPRERFALLFGDMLYNLRASLDYVIWQLCIRDGAELHKYRYFPACKTTHQWNSALGRELKGLDPTWIQVIDDLQPYHRVDRPEIHMLALLDHINNANKHRVLPPTITGVGEFRTLIHVQDVPAGEEFEQFFDETMRDGADLFRFRTASRLKLPVDMETKPSIRVTFPQGLGHSWTNREMVEWVFDALTRFEPAFPS